jgi:hypothetical protein
MPYGTVLLLQAFFHRATQTSGPTGKFSRIARENHAFVYFSASATAPDPLPRRLSLRSIP